MSWVCDTCSCNNDDDVLECFVCGSHRSEASIREAKRHLREKKMNDFAEMLYSKVFGNIKIATIVVGALFIVACIFRIVQGNLFADLEINTKAMIDTSSLQTKLFAGRWCDFDVTSVWLSKMKIVFSFVQSIDVPTSFKAFGLSMADLLNGKMILIYSNFLVMLPVGKHDHFVILYERVHNNIMIMGTNIMEMLPSRTKFNTFSVTNYKMMEKTPHFENIYIYCFNTTNDKYIGIKNDAIFIFETVQSNIERILHIIDSVVHRSTINVQSSSNYINRVISKFRK